MKLATSQTIKKKIQLCFYATLAVLIGISLVFLASLLFNKMKIQPKNNDAAVIQANQEEITKPKYFYVNKNTDGQPKVSAKAFLVGDLDTGEVIFSKNQDQKFPIASTSKLMTALVAKELSKEEDIAKVSKQALLTYGTNGELRLGEKIKTVDLVYPLLLESSNDAAEVVAEHFNRENFISKMNQQAQKLKMDSTSYKDPSGLSVNNQSTVADMFKLTGYLLQSKKELLEITTKRSYANKNHNWSNISQFLGNESYAGGKSGYTDGAMQTLVAVFNLPLGKDGYRPIAITLLQSSDRRKDAENIINYLKKNIYYGGEKDASTNWVQEKVGIPEIKEPNFVTLAFAGDIMLDRGVRNSVVRNFNNDYSKLFEQPKELMNILKKSDITFANLEGTASDQGADRKNLYSFRMNPSVVPALKGAGITVLSVANNHVGDWGHTAYIDTLARLKENEILYTGGGNNLEEAEKPAIIEKYGIKIGFLAFSDKGPNYMEAKQDIPGLLLTNHPRFSEIIKNASEQVDYLIVSYHFGEEYQTTHNKRQEELAHKAIDNGAKVVIGTHPHVMQDFEVYKNGYIAYSLGNFIFDQGFSENTMKGMLLGIKLDREGNITVQKNIVKLNSAFHPSEIIKGKEEKIKFEEINASLRD